MTPILKLPSPRKRWAAAPWMLGLVVTVALLFVPRTIHALEALRAAVVTSGTQPERLPVVAARESHSLDYATTGPDAPKVELTAGTPTIAVRRGTTITILGWAIDAGAKAPSAGVYATVDGHVFHGRTNLERQDVANAFGIPSYARAGFAVDISTAGMPPGKSRIDFTGVDAAGTGRYDFGRSIPLVLE